MPVKFDQRVCGELIKFRFLVTRREQAGVSGVAEVLNHQKALSFVRGVDGGCAQTQVDQVPGDADERPDILFGRWRVHQHGR